MSTRTVVITGGLGNLGTKLCRHLLRHSNDTSSPPPFKVILVEVNNLYCVLILSISHLLFVSVEGEPTKAQLLKLYSAVPNPKRKASGLHRPESTFAARRRGPSAVRPGKSERGAEVVADGRPGGVGRPRPLLGGESVPQRELGRERSDDGSRVLRLPAGGHLQG